MEIMVTDKKRLVDPEPIVMYMAIMATYAASVATHNYVRSHERPLPTNTRRAVLGTSTEFMTLFDEFA